MRLGVNKFQCNEESFTHGRRRQQETEPCSGGGFSLQQPQPDSPQMLRVKGAKISRYLCPSKEKPPGKRVASCTIPHLGHFFCLLNISYFLLATDGAKFHERGKNPNPQ